MARQVIYTYKGKTKTIAFSYDKHHDLYEAAAEAEGIDLTGFLAMEKQVALTSKKAPKRKKSFDKPNLAVLVSPASNLFAMKMKRNKAH